MTKVALVTGASSGMGESTAILLVNKGTRLRSSTPYRQNENIGTNGISVVSLDLSRTNQLLFVSIRF